MLTIFQRRKVGLWLCGIAGAVVALLSLAAPPALADSVTIDLYAYQGSQRGAYYGDVTLTLNSSGGIDVRVNLSPGYGLFGLGAFGFNVAGDTAGLAVTNLTSGFSFQAAPANHEMGGFGHFGYVINGPPGAPHGLLGLQFTVTRTGGFSSVSQLIALPTGQGSVDFVAHIVGGPNGGGAVWVGGTGPDPVQTPEPRSVALLGIGLAAIGIFKWRFWR